MNCPMNVVSYAQIAFKKVIFQVRIANANAYFQCALLVNGLDWSSLRFLWELELLMAAAVMQ